MENTEQKDLEKETAPEQATEGCAPAFEEKDAGKKKNEKTDKKAKAEIAKLKEENEKLASALAEEKDKYLRLAAEYDNFRRRSAKEKEGIYGEAIGDAVKEILPLFDNLARAGQFTEAEKVAEGLALMAKMSDEMLAKIGVTRFGEKGETFDANIHNAVMHEENDAFGENEIAEVFQVGYRRGDKIIRFAMVKVAN